MAEGWLRHFVGDKVEIYSAGTEIHGLNPRASKVMAEVGIDIFGHTSNAIDEYRDLDYDEVITVCDHAREQCPFWCGNANRTHRSFPDPAKATGTEDEISAEFRKVRDQIKLFCQQFAVDILPLSTSPECGD